LTESSFDAIFCLYVFWTRNLLWGKEDDHASAFVGTEEELRLGPSWIVPRTCVEKVLEWKRISTIKVMKKPDSNYDLFRFVKML